MKKKLSLIYAFFITIPWIAFFFSLILYFFDTFFFSILQIYLDLVHVYRIRNHRYKVIAFVVTLEIVAVPTYWAAYIRGSYLIWPPNRFDMFLIILRTFTYPLQLGAYFHLWFYHHYVVEE